MSKIYNPDYLKPLNNIHKPDFRSELYQIYDEETKEMRQITLEDHYNRIVGICLPDYIPNAIRIQFETAKNVYLYAWFSYRLFVVSEQQVLSCLEFALRVRFSNELPEEYWSTKKRAKGLKPTLSPLLRYAVDSGKIKNEDFENWKFLSWQRARDRYEKERIEEMIELGLDEIEIDESRIEISENDKDHDFVHNMKVKLPKIRNIYAHGSTTLHRDVLGRFRTAKEIICTIYN